MDRNPQKKRRRPLLLKLLTAGFLLLGWFGAMRLLSALNDWPLLSLYLPPGMYWYFLLGGLVWGLAGLVSGLLLWFGIPVASTFSRATALSCFVWYWLDRFLLTHSSLVETSHVFAWGASLLLLAFVFLTPVQPRVRDYLRKDTDE